MHLLAERFVFLGVMIVVFRRESRQLSNSINVTSQLASVFSVFTSIVCGWCVLCTVWPQRNNVINCCGLAWVGKVTLKYGLGLKRWNRSRNNNSERFSASFEMLAIEMRPVACVSVHVSECFAFSSRRLLFECCGATPYHQSVSSLLVFRFDVCLCVAIVCVLQWIVLDLFGTSGWYPSSGSRWLATHLALTRCVSPGFSHLRRLKI